MSLYHYKLIALWPDPKADYFATTKIFDIG
jgi:hypothetical protein